MLTHMLKPSRVAARAWLVLSMVAVPLLAANACSDAGRAVNADAGKRPADAGRLQLNLSATAEGQRTYRLTNATFTITESSSGASREVRADAGQERLSLELAAGEYTVQLHPGHALELTRGDSVSVVDAMLLSDNPATVSIATHAVTALDFIFQVGGDSVETGEGSGVLDLGIGVIESGAGNPEVDCSDAFEINDDQPLATALTAEGPLTASVCGFDTDYYRFSAPAPAGALFSVRSDVVASDQGSFVLSALIIDPAIVSDNPADAVVASISSDLRQETLVVSNGGEYLARVSLIHFFIGEAGFDVDPDPDKGMSYRLTVGAYQSTAENSCCETSATGGCNDAPAELCVCAADPACCTGSYDEWCSSLARLECGAQCAAPAPDSDCCTASAAPGCLAPDVQACVCDIDPYCCFHGFDQNCAVLAQTQCEAVCSP